MNEFDEGLGTVYERIMLNNMFDRVICKHRLRDVLEVPIYGMTGLTGINSVHFARRGVNVTLCDVNKNILVAGKLWNTLHLPINLVETTHFKRIALTDNTFDLVWNFAALWHLEQSPLLVHEMTRMSKNLVLIFVQNTQQPGFIARKLLGKLGNVHEQWLNTNVIKDILVQSGFKIIQEGVIDIPPFPDVAIPVGRKVSSEWKWNIMDYYMERDDDLLRRIEKYSWIEKSSLPFKTFWAHHKFVLGQKHVS